MKDLHAYALRRDNGRSPWVVVRIRGSEYSLELNEAIYLTTKMFEAALGLLLPEAPPPKLREPEEPSSDDAIIQDLFSNI